MAGTLAHRVVRSLVAAGPTLVLFALQRVVAISTLAMVAGPEWVSGAALRFDASWYLGIVTEGYHEYPRLGPDGSILRSNLAFFPLFPASAAALTRVVPVTPGWALLAVAWASGLVAAWVLFLIGRHLRGPGAGMALALAWGASTQSIVLVMGYSEALFAAVLAAALYAVLRDRPLVAAVATAFAGLTRPTSVALVATVGLWLVVTLVRKARDRDAVPHRWRVLLVSLVVTPAGLAAVLGFVAVRTGDLLGYFTVQRQWNMVTGWPHQVVVLMGRSLFPGTPTASGTAVYVPVVAFYLLLLALVAGWLAPRVRAGYGWLAAFTMLGAGLALTNQTYFNSMPRHLMGVLTLLLPLLDLRTSRWAAALALAAASLGSSWWGAHLVVHGHFSP